MITNIISFVVVFLAFLYWLYRAIMKSEECTPDDERCKDCPFPKCEQDGEHDEKL